LGGIKQNSPSENRIWAVWVTRDEEELSDDGEEEEDPEGRTFNDFIAYLRAEGAIRKGGERNPAYQEELSRNSAIDLL
jgi:hypothetical protein